MVEWLRLSRFPAKETLAHARALLSIETKYSSQNLKTIIIITITITITITIIIIIIIIIIITIIKNLILDVLADNTENTESNEQNGCLIYLPKHRIRDLLLHFIELITSKYDWSSHHC